MNDMIVTCNVIEDLLPLYADNICSADSRTVVEHHIAECPECKKKLEAMTAEIEKPPKPVRKNDNPFKKVSRHYTRLIIITLCICAAFLIPAATVFKLYINEETNQGITFSGLRVAREINAFGKMLKKGEYRAALDTVELYWQNDYTSEELNAMKDMFAEDMQAYFKKYPIKRMIAAPEKGVSKSGTLVLTLGGDIGGYKAGIRYFEFNVLDSGVLQLSYCHSGASDDTNILKNYKPLDYSFPQLQLIPNDTAEIFWNHFADKQEMFLWRFYTEETMNYRDSDEKGESGASKWDEVYYVYNQKIRELNDKYDYIGCESGKITYEHGNIFDYENYFLQHAALTMNDKSGAEFIIEFDMPVFRGDSFTHLQNVTYSENTPTDFKERFEDIFVSDKEVLPQFEMPKLTEGKFYLNGDKENCYFELKDGKMRFVIENDKQLHALYEAEREADERIAENLDFERWNEKYDHFSDLSEPNDYELYVSSRGAVIRFNVNYDPDGNVSGWSSLYYPKENVITNGFCEYIRVE